MKKPAFSILFRASLFFGLLLPAVPALAQDRDQDEIWQDTLIQYFEEEGPKWDIFGLAFVAVRGGRVTHLTGLGLADKENHQPIDPETTLFYLASTGKMFPAMAALDLKARGLLSLDENVNTYLQSFQVDALADHPITLRHLLTHADGMDDQLLGYAVADAHEFVPLAEYLKARLPNAVRQPGTIISYSNHGFGLAGLVSAEISGTAYKTMLESELFPALGMTDTHVIPFDDHVRGRLARAYRWNGDRVPFGLSQVPPAGGVAATPKDMANLLMHLVPGDREASRYSSMMKRQISHHPELPGRGLAFWEYPYRGQEGWLIAGSGYGYASLLYLHPESKRACFAVINRQEPLFLVGLLQRFQQHFLPHVSSAKPPASPSLPTKNLDEFRGHYRWIRYNSSSIEKVFYLFMTMNVRVDQARSILVTSVQDQEKQWRPKSEDLFQALDDNQLMAVRYDDKGRVRYLFNNQILTMPLAFEKLAWFESPAFLNPFFTFLGVLLLGICLASIFILIVRRFRKTPPNRDGTDVLEAKLIFANAWTHLVFILGFFYYFSDPQQLFYGVPNGLKVLLILPIPASILTVWQLGLLLNRRGSPGGWGINLLRYVGPFTFGSLCWLYWLFNLIGFHF